MRLECPTVGLALAAALCLSTSLARSACPAAQVAPGVAAQPERWQRAVAALAEASGTTGAPWSCTGGVIDLVTHDGGATLTVAGDDGAPVSREVSSPEEVEPLGEALLARPVLAVAPPVRAEIRPLSGGAAAPPDRGRDRAEPTPAGTPLTEATPPPRLLVSALLAPRYAGASNLVWGGITAAVAMPFGPWLPGAWVRYDGPSASLDEQRASQQELCLGASASRAFVLPALELRAGLTGSAAVVTRGLGEHQGEETRVFGRVGVATAGVLPVSRLLRAVVVLDAELAPHEIGGDEEREHQPEPEHAARFPLYTIGLGVGVELAPR